MLPEIAICGPMFGIKITSPGSRGTSFGPHVWNGGRSLLNYHTWKVVVNESKATQEFLLHALRYLTSYIEGRAHGASALVHTQK